MLRENQINSPIIIGNKKAACSLSGPNSVRELQAKQYLTQKLVPALTSLLNVSVSFSFAGCQLTFCDELLHCFHSPTILLLFVYHTPLGIQQNLHIVLIMDCSNSTFTINCESNPAFYRKCSVQWMEGWSESSMKKVSVGVGGRQAQQQDQKHILNQQLLIKFIKLKW